jgi:dipeptidyl aminopeptidase/acylaminoacyl peptidase
MIHNDSIIGKNKMDYSFFEDSKKYVMYDKVKNINCSVIMIHGEKDTSIPIVQAREIAKNIKNSKLIEFEGANHDFPKTESDKKKVYSLLIDFFK